VTANRLQGVVARVEWQAGPEGLTVDYG
jgi:hypothetical protein